MRYTATILAALFAGVALADDWGTIKGTVRWSGEMIPAPQFAAIPDNHADAAYCKAGKEYDAQPIVVNKENRGVEHVYVYLRKKPKAIHPGYPQTPADVEKAYAAEFEKENQIPLGDVENAVKGKAEAIRALKANALIDQVHCHYYPRALAVRHGEAILVKNADGPVNHNINVSGFDNSLNTTMPPNSVTLLRLKAEPTVIPIKCNIHGWMSMTAMVFDHPYFTLTDENGAFELKNLPAGEIELTIRNQDGLYIQRAIKVTVQGDGAVTDLGDIVWSGSKK